MSGSDSWRRETLLQHLGEDESYQGAVAPPLVLTSTFVFDSVEDMRQAYTFEPGKGYSYGRTVNPTLHMAEEKIAALEKMESAKLFSSGMAAISSGILSCIKSGSHVVCVDTVYGPTREFLSSYLPRFGVETTYVAGDSADDFAAAARENTTLFFLESPSSLIFRLQDLEGVAAAAKARGISTMIDNSFCSPWHQQPAEFGIDIVAHSASKYLGGHSDLVAGCLATSRSRMVSIIKNELSLFGGILHPFGGWQILRALRTLPLKLRAVAETSLAVAEWLEGQAFSQSVHQPYLKSFAQAGLRDKQMQGGGGLLSFVPKCQDRETLEEFANALKLFQLGVSWGGHESLVVLLQTKPLDWPEKVWLVRFYTGLEHPADLIEDIRQAAEKAGLLPA